MILFYNAGGDMDDAERAWRICGGIRSGKDVMVMVMVVVTAAAVK